ncbi:MAG: hypothetical protein ACKPKO_37720, partial [Candidatus Fonsibacter sp.]
MNLTKFKVSWVNVGLRFLGALTKSFLNFGIFLASISLAVGACGTAALGACCHELYPPEAPPRSHHCPLPTDGSHE